MLAVIPARTDPTKPLLRQAFQNAFYQIPAAERFIRGLARRDGAAVAQFGCAGLTIASATLLLGGLPGSVGLLLLCSLAALAALVLLARSDPPPIGA